MGLRDLWLDNLAVSAASDTAIEDRALDRAAALSPDDHCPDAEHLREVAADITDHRTSPHRATNWCHIHACTLSYCRCGRRVGSAPVSRAGAIQKPMGMGRQQDQLNEISQKGNRGLRSR
jgi:hypothetical protein